MKKLILLTMCILLISPAFADDYPYKDSSQFIQKQKEEARQESAKEASEQTFDQTKEQLIYDYYGSIESPAFLNRENIDPEEPNNGFTD